MASASCVRPRVVQSTRSASTWRCTRPRSRSSSPRRTIKCTCTSTDRERRPGARDERCLYSYSTVSMGTSHLQTLQCRLISIPIAESCFCSYLLHAHTIAAFAECSASASASPVSLSQSFRCSFPSSQPYNSTVLYCTRTFSSDSRFVLFSAHSCLLPLASINKLF